MFRCTLASMALTTLSVPASSCNALGMVAAACDDSVIRVLGSSQQLCNAAVCLSVCNGVPCCAGPCCVNRLCGECTTLVENHDKIQALSHAHRNVSQVSLGCDWSIQAYSCGCAVGMVHVTSALHLCSG